MGIQVLGPPLLTPGRDVHLVTAGWGGSLGSLLGLCWLGEGVRVPYYCSHVASTDSTEMGAPDCSSRAKVLAPRAALCVSTLARDLGFLLIAWQGYNSRLPGLLLPTGVGAEPQLVSVMFAGLGHVLSKRFLPCQAAQEALLGAFWGSELIGTCKLCFSIT